VAVQGVLDQRMHVASGRARAASLGMLTLLRRKEEDVLLGDDGGLDDVTVTDRLVKQAVALTDKDDCRRLAWQLSSCWARPL
jgi:hypothetical protein